MSKMNENGEYQRELVIVCDAIPFNKEKHYDVISKWWGLYYNGDPMPKECLPDTGCVIVHKKEPVAAAFIYKTNSSIVQIHFSMVDPALGAGHRIFFLRKVVEETIAMAKEIIGEKGIIWTCTDHAVVSRVYQENGLLCVGECDTFLMPFGDLSTEFMK